MDTFLAEFETRVEQQRLLGEGGSCVVAVSGGLDSRVLLGTLGLLAPRHGWRLVVAHYNHRLRGADSDADAAFVAGLARELGLAVVSGRADPESDLSVGGESPEARARRERHTFLARVAREQGCDRIAVGHHADDQVELFLLRLLRGSGGSGLSGMAAIDGSPYDASLRLVRPLLEYGREQLREVAETRGWKWREDGSNRDTRIPRNRLRHEVIPLLKRTLQPSLETVLMRVQGLLRDQAAAVITQAVAWLDDGRRSDFASLQVAVQREVIRFQLQRLQLEVGFERIETLRTRVEQAVTVDADTRVVRGGDGRIRLLGGAGESPAFRTGERWVELTGGCGVVEFGGVRISWAEAEATPGATAWGGRAGGREEGRGEEWMDADRVGRRVRLRHWRPGDRFWPMGLVGETKLQDLFTNGKVGVGERRGRVLLEAEGGSIVWVEGLRLGEGVRVTEGTRRWLHWRWVREAERWVPHNDLAVERGRLNLPVRFENRPSMKPLIAPRAAALSPSLTLAIDAKAKAMKAAGEDVVGFGAGEPDFDTPEHIKKAAADALAAGFTKYTPSSGIPELREAIAEKFKKENGLEYKPSQIIVSCGGKHSCFNVIFATCQEGDEVLIPSPYWLSYPEMVKLAGAKPVILETTDRTEFKVTPEQLKAAITPRTRLLVLNSPSNPTGSVYAPEEIRALGDLCVEHGVLIMSDEIYEHLLYDGAVHRSVASLSSAHRDQTIIVHGFAKAWSMTGWRLGFLAAPEPIAKAIDAVQSHSTSNPTSFAQKGAVAALRGPQDHLPRWLAEYAKRRTYAWQRLNAMPGVTCVNSKGAFYLFPNIRGTGLKSADFCARLLEQEKVAAVPGIAFGADDYIRLSYATSLANIEKGLDRLERFVGGLKRG